jgi:hypothetical protein
MMCRGTRAKVIWTLDVEMRHGRKSQHQRLTADKLSAMETDTAPSR